MSSDKVEKAWPKEYERVKGQDKGKGVSSKAQYRFMQAAAAGEVGDISASEAKDYLENSPKGGEGLPDKGTGGARGEREKRSEKDDDKKDKAKKSDDDVVRRIKEENRPKVVSFADQVKQIKAKYAEKKPRSFSDKVVDIKSKYLGKCMVEHVFVYETLKDYKTQIQAMGTREPEVDDKLQDFREMFVDIGEASSYPNATVEIGNVLKGKVFPVTQEELDKLDEWESNYVRRQVVTENGVTAWIYVLDRCTKSEKARDLFYAKVEGCLEKGVASEELLSNMMDVEAYILDDVHSDSFYKSADKYFDAILTPEEQVVYELSYMAKMGCQFSHDSLVKFMSEMYDELIKSSTIEDVIRDGVISSMRYMELRKGTTHLEGGLSDGKNSVEDLAAYHGVSVKFMQDQVKAGTSVEYEHTNDESVAKKIATDHLMENPHYYEALAEMEEKLEGEKTRKSEDDSKVKGKKNGESYRMVNGYARYTSGARRGSYVHRHEAEKRLGRKLKSDEHVHHVTGNRKSTKNTKVISRSKHTAETNKERAASDKNYTGDHHYAHHGSH